MPRNKIVINVYGGIVQDVFASVPDLNVVLVDWDDEGIDPWLPNRVEVPAAGGSDVAIVVSLPVEPLSELAGTDVEQAIDAACDKGVLDPTIGEPIC